MDPARISALQRIAKANEKKGAIIQEDMDLLEEVHVDKLIFIFRLLDVEKNDVLRVQDVRILGEAISGHPPTEADVKLQIHFLRARCLASKVIGECIIGASDRRMKSLGKNSEERRTIIGNLMSNRVTPALKNGLNDMFPDADTAKIMEKVYSKLSNKILEIFQKKKKSTLTFAKAKHSKTVRLNLTCNFMQYMMTEDILNMVKSARCELYHFSLEEFLYFSKLTLHQYTDNGLDDFIDILMINVSKLQCRLTNKQRTLIHQERKQKLHQMNIILEEDLQRIRSKAGIAHQVNAERLELERRKHPSDHDWRFIDGEWVEVVVSDGKMKIIKSD
eukprot:g9843.t1